MNVIEVEGNFIENFEQRQTYLSNHISFTIRQ